MNNAPMTIITLLIGDISRYFLREQHILPAQIGHRGNIGEREF